MNILHCSLYVYRDICNFCLLHILSASVSWTPLLSSDQSRSGLIGLGLYYRFAGETSYHIYNSHFIPIFQLDWYFFWWKQEGLTPLLWIALKNKGCKYSYKERGWERMKGRLGNKKERKKMRKTRQRQTNLYLFEFLLNQGDRAACTQLGMIPNRIQKDSSDPVLCLISCIIFYIFSRISQPDIDHSDIDIYIIYISEIRFWVFKSDMIEY